MGSSLERAKLEGCKAYLGQMFPERLYNGVVIMEKGKPIIQVVHGKGRGGMKRIRRIFEQIPIGKLEGGGVCRQFIVEDQGIGVVFYRVGEERGRCLWVVAWTGWFFMEIGGSFTIPSIAKDIWRLLTIQADLMKPSNLAEERVWQMASEIREKIVIHIRSRGTVFGQKVIRTIRNYFDSHGIAEDADRRYVLRVVSAFFYERVSWDYYEENLLEEEKLQAQLDYYLSQVSDLEDKQIIGPNSDNEALIEEISDVEKYIKEKYGLSEKEFKQQLDNERDEWRKQKIQKKLKYYLSLVLDLERAQIIGGTSDKEWMVKEINDGEEYFKKKFKINKKEFKHLLKREREERRKQVEQLRIILIENGYIVKNDFEVELSTHRGLFTVDFFRNQVFFESSHCEGCEELECEGKVRTEKHELCVEPVIDGWSNLNIGTEQISMLSIIHSIGEDKLSEDILDQIHDICPLTKGD